MKARALLLAVLLFWPAGGGAATPNVPEDTIRVLIVTGIDYPGHHWWKTTPVLETNLTRDPRVRVQVP